MHAAGFAFGNYGKNILIRVAKSLLFLKHSKYNKYQSSNEETPEFIEMLRVLQEAIMFNFMESGLLGAVPNDLPDSAN